MEGGLKVGCAGEFERFQGVDEAREDEEERDPGLALGHEAEDGPLEEVRCLFVVRAAGHDEPAREAEDHVRGDDEEGGDAAEALLSERERGVSKVDF